MKINPNRLWIGAIALGWLFDLLFWRKMPGINFAIFAVLCLLVGFFLLLGAGLRPNRNSLYLLPLFGFFAAVTFMRAEPMTLFLAYVLSLFTLAVFTVTYLGGRWVRYTVLDYLAKFLDLAASVIARPVSFTGDYRRLHAEAGARPVRRSGWPVLRGLIIALPIVAVFASLLASADLVFSQKLTDFLDFLDLDNISEYIFRLIYILMIGYALAGVIFHAAVRSGDEKLIGGDRRFIPAFLGFVEAAIVLGSVVALFVAFVAIQFQYFFGGQTNIHIDGYTYSEYARRGFGELVAVAFFSLVMLLALSGITKRETAPQRRAFSGLGIALVGLVLVMLVSAYQRLVLYEAAYGFSRLRTYTHIFLIWIGLLLIATIVLEVLHKEQAFALAALIAAFGFAVSLPILNVDGFIVRQNMQRELHAQPGPDVVDLDAQYFIDLSDDAVPGLVAAIRSQALPDAIKEKVSASLACIRHRRGLNRNDVSWEWFHFARYHADRSLNSIKNILDDYEINDTDWPVMVTTPDGSDFACSEYYYD